MNRKKCRAALEKELLVVAKQEQKLEKAASQTKHTGWKTKLEKKVPEKVCSSLEKAFCKAFSYVFVQGRSILERTYDKDALLEDHSIRDYAVQVKGRRRELRQMHKSARKSDLRNLALTTVEGIGLGALGIGLPDVVLFISTLLKGVYETALNYGYEYESRYEQMLILKMMAAALSSGEDHVRRSREIDEWMLGRECDVAEETLRDQIQETASVFAVDMLLLKFIQGLPVVGVVGGAANSVYYRKVLQYVQLKYRKRYLLALREQMEI